jgi:hypothetical protein
LTLRVSARVERERKGESGVSARTLIRAGRYEPGFERCGDVIHVLSSQPVREQIDAQAS